MPRAAAKSADRMTCNRCKLPIAGAGDRRAAVWLAVGPMHPECHSRLRAAVEKMAADALAAGTHTTAPVLHACGGCREWRTIWYRTLEGVELCYECTPEGNR